MGVYNFTSFLSPSKPVMGMHTHMFISPSKHKSKMGKERQSCTANLTSRRQRFRNSDFQIKDLLFFLYDWQKVSAIKLPRNKTGKHSMISLVKCSLPRYLGNTTWGVKISVPMESIQNTCSKVIFVLTRGHWKGPWFNGMGRLHCVHAQSFQSCLTLCNSVDCSLPGSSIHGILQGRILEWAAISFSRDLPDPGIEPSTLTPPVLVGGFFTTSATGEDHIKPT